MRAGDVIADQFELVRWAGAGGMGEVWQARDRLTGELVALKLLTGTSESGRQRFLRESVVLSDLRHPGIVRYVAHGLTPSEELYLVMEWLEGQDLAQRLARGTLSPEETVTLLESVAAALAVAHARGVVHRDLKPSNLFLPGSAIRDVKILDFGVARMGRATLTRGEMVGTPGYMAPEQARGDAEVDARADLFALGCVAFECLTGRRAFDAEHVMAVLAKILIDEVPRVSTMLPDVPADLDDLVLRLVAKDPTLRPRDAAELSSLVAELDVATSDIAEPLPSLTRAEQRIFGVVLAPPVLDEGATTVLKGEVVHHLRALMQRRGARLEPLADGSLVALLSERGVASDLAAQAAECALALRFELPERPLALTIGRAELGSVLAGDTIDRAARLLLGGQRPSGSASTGIILDEMTAGLLGAKFEVTNVAGRLELAGERGLSEEPRTLLGKATPCVGRDREIAALEATFVECSEEPVARAVLVTAPAGAGKSRLRNEVLARLARSADEGTSCAIWVGRGDPMRAGSPFALVGEMLRRAANIADGEPLADKQRKLSERVALRVPASERSRVAEFLGELVGAPFSDEGRVQLRTARQDPMLMSDQVRSAWLDFVAAECAAGPVVLALEDLHWGDLPTVKLVDAALRQLENAPLMVLAFARPEVHDVFPKLWEGRGLQEVRLGGLTKKASEKLVREVLGSSVTAETIAKVVERADGNAFYLEELIRAVADGRGEALPETVVAMVESRLAKLDPEARRVLRAGSVFGQTFWKGSASALLGGSARVSEWLRTLSEQELISLRAAGRFPGEEEYAFRHALLRDGAYAMLTEDDRALGHVLAGDWLERMGERDAMTLAEHFERGGAKDRALPWFPRATEQALEGNDLEGALSRAERGIACGAEGKELGLLRCLQAEARNWRGENAEALGLANEAMRLLPSADAAWFSAAREAIITAHKVGEHDRVASIVEMLEQVSSNEVQAVRAARATALGWAATMLLYAGKYALAEQILNGLTALAATEEAREPRLFAVVHRAKAIWAFYRGSPEARQWLEAALSGFDEAGDQRNASITRADLGFVFLEFGAYERAEKLFRQSLVEAERMGLLTSVAQVKQNLGLALLGLGKLEEAAVVETEAADALHAQGGRRAGGLAETYLARIFFRSGQVARAAESAEKAVKLLDAAPGSRAMALAVWSRAALRADQREVALERAREAMDLLLSLGALEEGEALVRLAFVEALDAAGEGARARSLIAEARGAILKRADNINDEALRSSFLTSVDENAETLALAQKWTFETSAL